MEITHNKLNNYILEMEQVVAKGQPFAKRNKERRVRQVLRQMRVEQDSQISFSDVIFYFFMWLSPTDNDYTL